MRNSFDDVTDFSIALAYREKWNRRVFPVRFQYSKRSATLPRMERLSKINVAEFSADELEKRSGRAALAVGLGFETRKVDKLRFLLEHPTQ
jgi:hypothetical protein